jgi:elongation factor P
MSSTEQLRKGMVIRHEGQLFTVTDYSTAQTGKQKATIHIKMRALRDGHLSERTLDQLGKIDEVPTEIRQMQFLYRAGDERVFMDSESFEQYSFGADVLGGSVDFLVEEETYRVLAVEGQPVSLQLPPTVVLEVVDTAPVEHAGGSTNVMKEAKLNSGLTIRVPLFIKNGDKIRVDADRREYQGKEH